MTVAPSPGRLSPYCDQISGVTTHVPLRNGRGVLAPRSRKPTAPRHPPGSPFIRPEPEVSTQTFEVNDRVTHDRYGLGTVTAVVDTREVTVDFGDRILRVSLPSAKLSLL